MKLFLSSNQDRNRQVIETLERYGLTYDCVPCNQIERCHVLELMTNSADCFEFLSPTLLRYKRSEHLTTNQLLEKIMNKKTTSLRLPLALHDNRVYPDLSPDDLRTFIPRKVKLEGFRQMLREQMEV